METESLANSSDYVRTLLRTFMIFLAFAGCCIPKRNDSHKSNKISHAEIRLLQKYTNDMLKKILCTVNSVH